MTQTRDERRKAERAKERERAEEIDRILEERPRTPFEEAPKGRIVDTPAPPPAKHDRPKVDRDGD